MPAVARIALAALQPDSGLAGEAYITACETLAVSLSRNGVAIISLPGKGQQALARGLQSLLASGTQVLPGCLLREWQAGGPADSTTVEMTHGVLDATARVVLGALCRSSLLRLRSDAFSPVLDDLPLARSTQGSSLLTARSNLDNFGHLTATQSAALAPLFADPQEEVTERGLLGLFYHREAADAKGVPLSAMQVRDSEGRWQDVQLGEHEVAVCCGATLRHATAGLLCPAVHRVVGQPYGRGSGSGRRVLHFELRPRPSAVLDLREQLEAAGHTVSARYSPVSVGSLMEQFESLMSPGAAIATPDQQAAAAAHAAWQELQAAATQKRKKRASLGDEDQENQPVTRSGQVRRGTDGVVTRRTSARFAKQAAGAAGTAGAARAGGDMEWEQQGQQAQQAQQAAEAAGPSRRRSGGAGRRESVAGSLSLGSMGSGASGASRRASLGLPAGGGGRLCVVRGRTCTVLDGCLEDGPSSCISICVRSFTGLERWFYMNASTNLGRIFEMYCARLGIGLGAVKFLLRGERVFGASTPAELKMKDGEELTAVPEAADSRRQMAELGPLFATVFGSKAAAAAGVGAKPELI
ncbi:hypothetical protein C2E21_7638 [Chlorella sorokiniana]|uniref:Uncharacterized protein n=1 Tax=Chlorella sorokiniana TaxID=3076 RepID=A0A2P6TH21_CHLSO|nr:hypothetical protein C2E21_7638 [Chlorella sorokiniana]|eukprot:PRW33581.1 hypothetical protein C2E21_7638 [Chlorella sorokiniana]